MSESTSPLAVVVGAGPGLGTALAARFAAGGCQVAVLSRSAASRAAALERIAGAGQRGEGYDCDVGDAASVADAFARLRATQGDCSVLLYNAGVFLRGGILELDPAVFEQAWRVNCQGALLVAREVVPAMLRTGAGALIFTGATAALRGGAGFAGLAVGKFGLRALAQSLARELGPRGVHVAHVVIDGQIATPARLAASPDAATDSLLAPAAIAENFWQLYRQPRSAWTQEMDLRPYAERF